MPGFRQGWHNHGNFVAVSLITVAVNGDEISLFKPNCDKNVDRCHQCEEQMRRCHDRCGPERQQPADIQRMTNVSVEEWRTEFQVRVRTTHQVEVYLPHSEKVEMINQESTLQHDRVSES